MLIVRRSKLYYAASGIITPVGGRPVHRLRDDARSTKHQKNVEFYSKNKFEKLVHLVGFTIRGYDVVQG